MMYQTHIEFFWPLTEQIPLPLDFTDCSKPKLYTPIDGFTLANSDATWTTAMSSSGVTINCGTLTVKGMPMPWYRKMVFKLMGFKWND
jgi:hypothetical protein